MLKASALIYSLFISLLLISLCSALIALSYTNSLHLASWSEREKTERNAMSGMVLLQHADDIVLPDEEKTMDLFGNGNDSVRISRKTWGAFEVHVSRAFSAHHRFCQVALSGNSMEEDSTLALYLADQDRPLSLCGKTEIRGTCFLPKSGVKRAYIEGQNFVGTNLIQGEMKLSTKSVYEVNKNLVSTIEKIFNSVTAERDSLISVDETGLPSLNRSFLLPTVCCRTTVPLRIGASKLRGNILLVSTKEIRISQAAALQDIVVCAPKVIIEKGFSGCLQVFAYDSVIVEEKTKLTYPSVIGLIRQRKSCQSPSILLKEESELSGTVFAYQETTDPKNQVKIGIDKGAAVTGFVYSNGLLDMKGSVSGSVTCTKFILGTPSSVYENHLLNATIDRTALSKYFVATSLRKEAENKKTVKWLY